MLLIQRTARGPFTGDRADFERVNSNCISLSNAGAHVQIDWKHRCADVY